MFARATPSNARPTNNRRGSALISAVVVFVGIYGLLYATIVMSGVELRESRRSVDDVRSEQLANAGVERGMLFLRQASQSSGSQNPLNGLTSLFTANATINPFVGASVLDGASQISAFSVALTSIEETTDSISVTIESTGYVPDAPQNLAPGQRLTSWSAVRTTVRYELAPSEVFDYAYFINNWGWFYGDTIYCNGNARSNGQFDVGGYAPTVTGQPLYDSVNWNGTTATLSGYHDDNGDGLADGNDGGVFSGWDVVKATGLKGNGGRPSNQHDFQDRVEMPNLSDLGSYEANAIAEASTIKVGATTLCNAVYGDEVGERQNLYLVGTAANPIVLDGPVVVRGDVVISGYVTGQGAIYAGGNVYVPDSIKYVNGPTSTRPATNAQADTEAWLSTNWNKDFLGLFARENIVVGDHTSTTWKNYVGPWMTSSMNGSKEDAGEDGIPNTLAGRDGILGTADDDVLEADGVFTIDYYTADDAAQGLIPAGKAIGDPIPGTGEDIDGDGVYDGTTTLADVTLNKALNTTNFGGNIPTGGIATFSSIATNYATQIDAVLYTNHSFCYVVLGTSTARINGAIVSRNENIVYGTPTIEMNHDVRLLGGASGMASGLLPQSLQSPQVLRWTRLDTDPNRYVAAP